MEGVPDAWAVESEEDAVEAALLHGLTASDSLPVPVEAWRERWGPLD